MIHGIIESREERYAPQSQQTSFLPMDTLITEGPNNIDTVVQVVLDRTDAMDEVEWNLGK